MSALKKGSRHVWANQELDRTTKTLPITRFRHIQNCSLVTTSFSHHAGLISFVLVVITITILMMSGQEEEMRVQAGNTGGLNLHVKVGGI